MNIRIEWDVSSFEAGLAGAEEMIRDRAERGMKELSENMLHFMQGKTPVRTGTLRGNDQVDFGGLEFKIYNRTGYAVYNEFGTSPHRWGHNPHISTPERPFLRPTMDYGVQTFLQTVGGAIRF